MNRAVIFRECDWWSFIDPATFRDWKPIGNPALFFRRDTRDSIRAVNPGLIDGRKQIVLDDIKHEFPEGGWTLLSATIALVLAAHLGATSIDVFGADWTDEPDFDGLCPAGCNRDETRWSMELVLWGQLVDHFQTRGISVTRK